MSYQKEDESIDCTIFVATLGLGDITNNLFSSNLMSMMSSFAVIFTTGATYSCSHNKEYFAKLEENTFPRNIKGIARVLEIYGFWIVKYSVRSES